MAIYRSEMSVPIRVDTSGTRQPTAVPIVAGKGYSTLGGKSASSSSWINKSHDDDLFSRFDDSLVSARRSDSERWFEDMRRRFDERRRQWDAEMREMRSSFFNTPAFPLSRPEILTSASSHHHSPPSTAEDCPVVTSYERGVDGNLHFLAQFDVQPFHQDDVHVTVRDSQIVVTAVREQRIGTSSTSKQVTRTVDLPRGAQESLITASISADNVLLVDVPVGSTTQSLSFNTTPGSSGTSGLTTPSTLSGTGRSSHLSSRASPAPSFLSTQTRPRFHVEIPVGSDYKPEEIQIRTLNNRAYVSARHEERRSNRSTFREFSKEYDIPDHIDPKSIRARLEYGVLHLEGSALS
ncbi:Major egg antigen [Echinococcus granulosus]|uniref:Major egg antigen p40 n=2 Tax=Echinococcus granulosus TaxID=6210 RepID=A0A068WF69_ECHGR|nr:Major egg antigen [Echinococcus granulosus]CDS16227.1 Major egg antigen p40 [Echinococcus granulosus]